MESHRQSILQRKKRNFSKGNEETSDKEYEKELARLESKRKRWEDMKESRRKAHWGTPEEKKELQEQQLMERELHLRLKEQRSREEKLKDAEEADWMMEKVSASEELEAEREQARREYLRSLMEENRQLIQEREEDAYKQHEEELEEELSTVAPGASLFDKIGHSYL
eukprot:gb/GECH01011685.1/.p1 GENE.gb/GECH01011685.1/~~gb/GECH01011685.1/.p1  ORF type:complete len:167 (+),score=59.06 gb/GECH01011685.1/:1-501(+)